MRFYLGTHMPHWLNDTTVPLFVSHRRLCNRRRLPRAATRWALDSGAFSEVAGRGRFETTPRQYVRAADRYAAEIGQLDWIAPQDHMCEPWVLARSELANTVIDAQHWTVNNYLELRAHQPVAPLIPVLQGQTLADYYRHVDMYAAAGVNLEAEPLVGVGSVCRRQATRDIAELVAGLHFLRLHGFGVKTSGLGMYGRFLTSADSMAWSYNGRRVQPCPVHGLTSCGNCRHHALEWRKRTVVDHGERPVQLAVAL